jgi:hypothetical protein
VSCSLLVIFGEIRTLKCTLSQRYGSYRGREEHCKLSLFQIFPAASLPAPQFIERATCQDGQTVGHGWCSYTAEVQPVKVKHPTDDRPVVFVDTPGLDHTYMSDTEILVMITDWLAKM